MIICSEQKEPRFNRIIAHIFGRRSEETFQALLMLLKPFTINFFCTDDFKVYASNLTAEKHITGKFFTQRIER